MNHYVHDHHWASLLHLPGALALLWKSWCLVPR